MLRYDGVFQPARAVRRDLRPQQRASLRDAFSRLARRRRTRRKCPTTRAVFPSESAPPLSPSSARRQERSGPPNIARAAPRTLLFNRHANGTQQTKRPEGATRRHAVQHQNEPVSAGTRAQRVFNSTSLPPHHRAAFCQSVTSQPTRRKAIVPRVLK